MGAMERDCLIEVFKSQEIVLEVKVAVMLLNKTFSAHMNYY
jgi:hypothetical protein